MADGTPTITPEMLANVDAWGQSLSTAKGHLIDAGSSIQTMAPGMDTLTQGANILVDFSEQWNKQLLEVLETQSAIAEAQQDGVNAQAVYLKRLGKIKRAISAELLAMQMITKEREKQTGDSGQQAADSEKAVGADKKRERSHTKIAKEMKQEVKALGQSIISMGGIQLSLVGILATILDIHNETRRISAMGKQIASQWKGGMNELRGATKIIGQIRGGFQLSYDAVGEYVNSLAKAGFEQRNIKRLGKEILAIQFAQGVPAAQQVDSLKNLVNNFGLVDTQAQDYLVTLREASKELGEGTLMSMGEITSDWEELITKTRAYNTDLLGTLAMYNALSRKDVAEDLGLGDAPLEIRKSIVQTVAGFSQELSDGWKAALGEGTDAAGRIMEFERLGVDQQFERFAKFINQKTATYAGDQKALVTRQLLKDFGFNAAEVRKVLGDAFVKGEFSGENLSKAMGAIKQQRTALESIEKKAGTMRRNLVKTGQSISVGLQSLQTLLKNWVRQYLRPYVTQLVNSVTSLISTIKNSWLYRGPTERDVDPGFKERNTIEWRNWKDI
jgi:hypothetical protein